jgi:hypothetical protein
MRNRMLAATALAAVTVFAAACDGGATGPGNSSLTRSEALALSHSLFGVGAGLSGGNAPSASRGARIQAASGSNTFSFSFDTTEPCPAGGNVGLKGTLAGGFDAVAHAGQVTADVDVAHAACKVPTDQGTFTLNGDPNIAVGLNAASGASGVTAFHLTENGAFTWDRGDGNSGRCTVDVAADLVAGTQNVALTGTFCGFPVDGTIEHVGG